MPVARMGYEDLSADDLYSAINSALAEMFPRESSDWDTQPWIRAVYPIKRELVYCLAGKYYLLSFACDDAGNVTLQGDPSEVNQKTVYEPADSAFEISLPAGSDTAAFEDDYVPWGPCKIFQAGSYPAQGVEADSAYLDVLASSLLDRIPLRDTHNDKQSIFSGKLGWGEKVWRDGDDLYGSGMIHRAIGEFVGKDTPIKASVTIHKPTKRLLDIALLNFPQVSDAQISAAFAQFASARHNTADRELFQGVHDHAAALGATCGTAKMAGARHSKKDQSDIQAIHDLASKQGASCPDVTDNAPMGRPDPATAPSRPTQEARPMAHVSLKDRLKALFSRDDAKKALADAGVNITLEEIESAEFAAPSAPIDPALKAQLEAFDKRTKALEADALVLRTNALNTAAAQFANAAIADRRAVPAEREELQGLYKMAVNADGSGVAEFGEDGALKEGDNVKLLRESIGKRLQHGLFQTSIPNADPSEASVQVNQENVKAIFGATGAGEKALQKKEAATTSS